ncbi:type I restriction-modification enzyme R subunit C-terminal domain-containing protein [Pseudodesulfovibrio indicus]|uniref:type I restriction endonuclease subunit R n=1 Tax=Pseudodesulfovibrio indicus TaxID=1716143 RepID=UPI00292D320F|nr:type I restriction-modification enzyme R subunit C-terminal domain-containing protein [Pseudodesulfovibrio indicus]
MPELDITGLRDCQTDALRGLEASLADDHPRSLIQMATGAGKTFTACTFSYRLIKHARARRILFLVDRNNLGDQTLREYQAYHPPGTANRFAETYITQHLHSNRIDPSAKVVITTIQRLFSMLKGEEELDAELEEQSAYELHDLDEGETLPVTYNPDIPIETFDVIVTDECHRSIYGLWRQVLEYFDAHIIGLTATPSKHTLGFFNQNLVAEYPFERSVADGVNVGYEVFRIKTAKTEQGGVIQSGYSVPVVDKRTRKQKYRELDQDLKYKAKELDKSVTARNQIRSIIQCYKDHLFTDLFPGRSGEWVPKTLIFAKDDNHAEEIVHIVREVFGEGNDFCKKVTYKNSEDPKSLIKAFRVEPMPRIAVTVDMIATGTDIKPLETIIFLRDVKSEGYYEQMKGRGARSISDSDLRSVTPDAQTKTRFVLVDAVGVTEGQKTVSQPLERKRTLTFDKLLTRIAQGERRSDFLSTLAGRLAALDKKLEPEDRKRVIVACDKSLNALAGGLLNAIDPDVLAEAVRKEHGDNASPEQIAQVKERLQDGACAVFDDPDFRKLLVDLQQKTEIVVDESADEVLSVGYDLQQAEARILSFKDFIEANKDELTALQILYSQPHSRRKITYAAIRELRDRLADPPYHLDTATVWQAYKRLEESKVRGAPSDKMLTDIISLVRFAVGLDKELEPFATKVEQRFNLWIGRQKKAGKEYSEEQMAWLRLIKNHLAANVEIAPKSFMESTALNDQGGLVAARKLFGEELNTMLDDLNGALVA